jgi:hypothetical protein
MRQLTIPTGATSGERITINVGNNGAILVYNNAGQLIASIAPALGTAADTTVYDPGFEAFTRTPGTPRTAYAGGATFYQNDSNATVAPAFVELDAASAFSRLIIDSGTSVPTDNTAQIIVWSHDGTGLASVVVKQEDLGGALLTGTAIANDDTSNGVTGQPRFQHTETYPVTFTAGVGTLTHNCAFTPTLGLACGKYTGGTAPGAVQVGTPGATTVVVSARQPDGTALPNGTYPVNAVLYG